MGAFVFILIIVAVGNLLFSFYTTQIHNESLLLEYNKCKLHKWERGPSGLSCSICHLKPELTIEKLSDEI